MFKESPREALIRFYKEQLAQKQEIDHSLVEGTKKMQIETLVGKTIKEITGAEQGSDRITITTSDEKEFLMYHTQDCCESVQVEDVAGEISDLIGSPILLAEEVTNDTRDPWPEGIAKPEYSDESYTWTFYKLSTIKGSATIRWYGSSNGYYSESVSFEEA